MSKKIVFISNTKFLDKTLFTNADIGKKEIDYKNTKEKGDAYEIYIRDELAKNKEDHVWLWQDIPESILRDIGILGSWNEHRLRRKDNKENGLPDLGCDILVKTYAGDYVFVQCKHYNENNSIRIEDLGGFYLYILTYGYKGIVYHTSKISGNIHLHKPSKDIEYLRKDYIQSEPVKTSRTTLMSNPFNYQIEAYDKLVNKHRAVVQLPCGMGKTLISMLIAGSYQNVIIISPLKEYCQQNLEKFKNEEYYANYKSKLIDSDGTRDVEEIKTFLQNKKDMILSVTYKSVDVLNQVIGFIEESYIVIFDEFHNISQNDIYPDEGTKTPINTLLNNPNAPILFMSATPRIFDLEDEYLNEKMFGKIEYSYGMGDAIRNKYICDYDIYVPDVHVDNSQTTTNIHKEIKISKLIKFLSPKIHFLVKGCLETGSKKCIAYFKSQEDAKNFNDSMLKLNEYYCLNLMVDIIISDDTQKSRRVKLNNFTEHKGLAILCSVKILDECIDIPACDSIYIDSPGSSKIRNIQRISRANRLDKNNPHKKSRIFIWADEYNDTVSMIKHLKEFDDDFKCEKIKIINSNIDRGNVVSVQNTRKVDSYVELYGLIVGIKKVNTWENNLEKVETYIQENNKLPTKRDKDPEIKKMGIWLISQKINYKTTSWIMKNNEIRIKWKEFIQNHEDLFLSNEELWEINLEKVETYIQENNKLPTDRNKDPEIRALGVWLANQKRNYNKKSNVMKNNEIRIKWEEFIQNHEDLFLSNKERWENNLEKA